LKKKILISFILALVMVVSLTGAAFAMPPGPPPGPPPAPSVDITGPAAGYVGDEVTVTGDFSNLPWYAATYGMVFSPGTDIGDWPYAFIIDGDPLDLTFTLAEAGDYTCYFGRWYGGGWGAHPGEPLGSFVVKASEKPKRSPYDWYRNGQFELAISNLIWSHVGYNYIEVPVDSGIMEIAPDITQFARCPGGQLIRIDIPSGTTVTDQNGDPVYKVLVIYFNYYGIEPYFEIINGDDPGPQGGNELHFSNPMEISLGSAYNPFAVISDVADGFFYLD
jgi:hypothetical protein